VALHDHWGVLLPVLRTDVKRPKAGATEDASRAPSTQFGGRVVWARSDSPAADRFGHCTPRGDAFLAGATRLMCRLGSAATAQAWLLTGSVRRRPQRAKAMCVWLVRGSSSGDDTLQYVVRTCRHHQAPDSTMRAVAPTW